MVLLTAMLAGVLVEQINVRAARLERRVRVVERGAQVDGDDIVHGDVGRVPAACGEAAVHPVDVAVRAIGSGDLLCAPLREFLCPAYAKKTHIREAPEAPQDQSETLTRPATLLLTPALLLLPDDDLLDVVKPVGELFLVVEVEEVVLCVEDDEWVEDVWVELETS